MKNKGDWIFGISLTVITVLILTLAFIFKDDFAKDEKEPDTSSFTTEEVYEISLKEEPMLGDKNAPITIVEYADYKCPACGYFNNAILPVIEAEYIETGKANIVFKNFPFLSDDSDTAARYTEAVYSKLGNDEFWEISKELFDYHNTMYNGTDAAKTTDNVFDEDFLYDTSVKLFGKEKAKLLKGSSDEKEFKNEVYDDINEGKSVDVIGTPTVYVNGKQVLNPLDYNTLVGAIEEALAESGVKESAGDNNAQEN